MAESSPIKARGAGEATAQPERLREWPLDESGQPMIQVTVQASELIGLEEFSNVTVGPSNITMFIPKGQSHALDDDEAEALASAMNQLAGIVEVEVVAANRDVVLDTIDPKKRK